MSVKPGSIYTSSKLAIETPEKMSNIFKVNDENNRTKSEATF